MKSLFLIILSAIVSFYSCAPIPRHLDGKIPTDNSESDPEIKIFWDFKSDSLIIGKGYVPSNPDEGEAYKIARNEAIKQLVEATQTKVESCEELVKLESISKDGGLYKEKYSNVIKTTSNGVVNLSKEVITPIRRKCWDEHYKRLAFSCYVILGVPTSAAADYIMKTIEVQKHIIDSLRQDLEKTKKQLETSIENAENSKEHFEKSKEKLENEIGVTKKQTGEIKKDTEKSKHEIKNLKKEIKNYKNKADSTKAELKKINTQLEELKNNEEKYSKIDSLYDYLKSQSRKWEEQEQYEWRRQRSSNNPELAKVTNVLDQSERILLTNYILFDKGKTDCRDTKYKLDNERIVEDIINFLLERLSIIALIRIDGYSDPTPPIELTHFQFAERRALSIKSCLVEKGIPEELIITRGFGPVGLDPKSDYNRRAEIYVSFIE